MNRLRDLDFCTRSIRTRPLTVAALMFLTGCILAYAIELPVRAFIAFAAACAFCACLLRRRRRISVVFLLLICLPLGGIRFQIAWHAVDPLPDQTGVSLAGRICDNPDYRADTERSVCVLDSISVDGTPIRERIRLYLRGDTALLQNVTLGQNVSCTAHIWRADEATNPGQFNFSNYLRVNGFSGYATAEIEEAVLSDPSLKFRDLPARFRRFAGSRIDRLFPENAGIARAFLIGDRSQISEEDRQSYSSSGAAHLLALSGMHITLISTVICWVLMRFMRRKRAFAVTLSLLLIYGWLIGYSASFARALMMFAAAGFARIFGRRYDSLTALSLAMLIGLIYRPLDILSASFVMSYGASAGIILLAPVFAEALRLEPQFHTTPVSGLSDVLRRALPSRIAQMICVTAAAQLAILPAVIHYFGAQPMLSFFVNLFAVPPAMLAYLLAIPGSLFGIAPICRASDWIFGLLTRVVRFFGALPYALLRAARFPIWLVLICAAACLFASGLSRLPKRLRMLLPLTVVLAMFASNLCAQIAHSGTRVVFLSAGEADCAVIHCGGRTYLIDAGDDYSPAADYLSAMKASVEAVFLTHPHADHILGMEEILDYCAPKRIYISPNWDSLEPAESVLAAMDRAKDTGCEIVTTAAGDEFALDAKTSLRILTPQAGFSADSPNEDSMVIQLACGESSVLFLADAPAARVETILPDADLIKVAHHGAEESLSEALLEAVSPSACVISLGYNTFGHPAERTLELIEASGAALYRTDMSGALTCVLNENGGIRITPYM